MRRAKESKVNWIEANPRSAARRRTFFGDSMPEFRSISWAGSESCPNTKGLGVRTAASSRACLIMASCGVQKPTKSRLLLRLTDHLKMRIKPRIAGRPGRFSDQGHVSVAWSNLPDIREHRELFADN